MPAADTAAPAIALSASQLSPQGGETVVLTADVTDNRDTGLSATLSCDAGTLRGDFLIIPETDTGLTIACTATAQDAAGNEGATTLDIVVAPTVTTVALADGQSTAAQGEALVIFTENLSPTLPTYTGQLSGEEVSVNAEVAGGLSVIVPFDMPPGEHILSVEIDRQLFSFVITVEETPDIADPNQIVSDAFNEAIALVSTLLSSSSIDLTAAETAELNTQRAELEASLADLSSFAAEDIQTAAKFLTANNDILLSSLSSARRALSETETCTRETTAFVLETLATVGSIYVTVGLTAALVEVPPLAFIFAASASYKIIDRAFSEEGVAATAVTAYECNFDRAAPSYEFSDASLADFSAPPVPAQSAQALTSLAEEDTLTFILEEATDFTLQEVTRVEGSTADEFFSALDKIRATLDRLVIVPESITSVFEGFPREVSNTVEDGLTLATISNADIRGDLAYMGGNGTLSFDYIGTEINQLDDGIDFTFAFTQSGEARGTFDAKLTAMPQASDAMITVIADTPSQFDVTAFGSSAEITLQPTKGRVEVVDYDTFIYTADAGTMGEDSFQFATLLGTQRSPDATVFINIVADVPDVEAAAFTFFVEDFPLGEADFDLDIENADRIQIVRAPAQGTIKNLQPDGRFTYAVNDGAFGDDSFDYTAENAAGVSETATVTLNIIPLPVDCSVFEELVLGNWTVNVASSPDVTYDLELIDGPEGSSGGTGVYTFRETSETFPMSWSILEVGPGASTLGASPGCVLVDTGFFNAGFNGLLRSNLTNPVTTHFKYELGGVFGFPAEGNYFGLDLSTQTPNVTFTKQ